MQEVVQFVTNGDLERGLGEISFNKFANCATSLVWCWVQMTQVILAQHAQRLLHMRSNFLQCRYRLTNRTILPVDLIESFDLGWNHEGSFRLLEWMPAEYFLAHLRCRFIFARQNVYDGPALGAIQSEHIFTSRHRDLLDVLTQFDASLLVDLDELVDAS